MTGAINIYKFMKNVGVFFGSSTPEHDVSIITAWLIISELKKMDYKVTPVYLTKERKWLIGDELGQLKFFTDGKNKIKDEEKKFEYLLDLSETKGKMVFQKKGLFNKRIKIDLAFPAFHGAFGEDGTMQGIFEIIGVPYVGCGVASSAMTMDKAITKVIYERSQIKTTKYFDFTKEEWNDHGQDIISRANKNLKWPVFVKPVHLGSSIGIVKVKEPAGKELELAIESAFYYDDKVLIEEGVDNLMDLTCCVIGNNDLRASEVQESTFGSELFDFNEKYIIDGGTQLGNSQSGMIIPARLDENTAKDIKELSKKIYKIFGCSGIARIDFLYNKETKEIFANEVNTLPGILYSHLWKASGLEFRELLEKLMAMAQEKFEEKNKINFVFDSEILKQLNGTKLSGKKLG